MIHTKLLPSKVKSYGWVILILSLVLWIGSFFEWMNFLNIELNLPAILYQSVMEPMQMFTIVKRDILPTLIGCLFIAGSCLIIFSKEKHEDEMIALIRLNSLLWAVGCNSLYLLFSFMFVHGFAFTNILVYNIGTIPIIFIARFYYQLYKVRKMNQ